MAKAKSVQVGDVVKSSLNDAFLYVVHSARGPWVDVYEKDYPAEIYKNQRRSIFTKADEDKKQS